MKKKFLLFGAGLMLTGVLFTTGCKKAVDNLTTNVCTICTENTTQIALPEQCNIESVISSYETNLGSSYTCVRQ